MPLQLRERLAALRERLSRTGPMGLVGGAALLAAALALHPLVDARGLRRWRALRRDVARQRQANELLRLRNAELERVVRTLGDPVDPAALERAARDQLGFVKPDEIVFKFE